MKLKAYLKSQKLSHTAFAKKLGVTRASVSYYVSGERIPRYNTMQKIERLTKGKVGLKDW